MIDDSLVVELATGLAAIPSESGNEREIGEWLAERLTRGGATVELQSVVADRPNVLASVAGRRPGATVLLNGHIDTLPVDPGLPRPFDARVDDGWVYGAGINNMKGAVAAMAAALLSLEGTIDTGRVVLAAVMGECDALGLGTVSALNAGLTADACINGEPTELRVLTEHAGVTQLWVDVRGREAHVYEVEAGADAIVAAARVIASLDPAELRGAAGGLEKLPMIHAGTIEGGTWPSLVAAHCRVGVDVRSTGAMTPDSIRADIERMAVHAAGEGFGVSVTLRDRPGFVQQVPFHADPDSAVVKAVGDAVRVETSQDPEIGTHWPESFFGTDASHIARAGIPTVICGPGSHTQISRPDERVAVTELGQAARIYAQATRALLAESAG